MKLKLLFVLLCGLTLTGYTQPSFRTTLRTTGRLTLPEAAYCLLSRDASDTTRYAVQIYSADERLLAEGHYQARTFPVDWAQLTDLGFRDALKEGAYREYHPNGKLKFEGSFQAGEPQGIHRRWYDGGQLLSEVNITTGTAKARTYYPSGQLKTEFDLVNGLPKGYVTEYQPDGTQLRKTSW